MLERAVQFCLEIGDSGFELRGFRFRGRRSLTLDVVLGLNRKVRRLAFGGQLFELLLVLLELGDRLLGLVQLGFEGGGFLLRVRTDLVDLTRAALFEERPEVAAKCSSPAPLGGTPARWSRTCPMAAASDPGRS